MLEPDFLLSVEQLEHLTDAELAQYQQLLEAAEAVWEYTDKQKVAKATAGEVDWLLYGGSAGPGKTNFGLHHAWDLSIDHAKHKTLILRRNLIDLRDVIYESLTWFDQRQAKYMVGPKEWQFGDTGSIIRFGHCDTEEDVRHFLSFEYDLIWFEESTEFSQTQFDMIRSRCRTTRIKRSRGVRPHVILTTNPGQIGHDWHKRRFVEPTDYGAKRATETVRHDGKERVFTKAFIPARVEDNPHIDPDYVFNLASNPDPIKRAQYLEGDWDVFAGMFFTEWSPEVHVVEPFEIPRSWPRRRAIDYGYAAPFCCLWGAWDPDGNCYIYRELYKTRVGADEQARMIVAASTYRNGDAERILETAADPSIWNTQGSGMSIAQQYRSEGLVAKKAMNKRIDGWQRVRKYLRPYPEPHVHGDRVVKAPLQIFSTCTNLRRELPQLIHDPDHPEDTLQGTAVSDHAADTIRYLLALQDVRARENTPDDRRSVIEELIDRHTTSGDRHPVLGRM